MNVQICIGDYIRTHGIKQTYVAEKCGWSKQKTSVIMQGKQKISAEDMAKVCNALGVSYDFFYNLADGVDATAGEEE